MRIPVAAAGAVCGVVAIVLVTAPAESRAPEDPALVRDEVARLRAHFDSVVTELKTRDVSDLGPPQRAARAQMVRALEAYRDRGVFPHNHDSPNQWVPFFRDEHGTLCAMAYLVASTGRGDIVDDVARERNNAYIPELTADGRLVTWLDSVGLTVEEAARIQPAYRPQPPPAALTEARDARRYVVPSLALGMPAFVTTVLNSRAPPERRADASLVVGAISGAGAAILGAAILAEMGDPSELRGEERERALRAVGVVDLAVGTAALVSVVRRNLRRASPVAPRPPIASEAARFSIDLTPTSHAGRLRPAAHVRVRF